MSEWNAPLFFVIAFFYSMIGFGGGSSYIALMVLTGVSYTVIPITALSCNTIVAAGNLIHFYFYRELELKKILPFMLLSVPASFWAGQLIISEETFCLLLGISIFLVAIRLSFAGKTTTVKEISQTKIWILGLPIGGILGFLSGLLGIGGGIFLSPMLLMLKWSAPRQAAAAASIFILVNSISGWIGQAQKGISISNSFWILALSVFLGGQLGAFFSKHRLPPRALVRLLALLIFYVSIRLIMRGL